MERSPEEARRYDQQAISVVEKIESQFRLTNYGACQFLFLVRPNGLTFATARTATELIPVSLLMKTGSKRQCFDWRVDLGRLDKHTSATHEWRDPAYRNLSIYIAERPWLHRAAAKPYHLPPSLQRLSDRGACSPVYSRRSGSAVFQRYYRPCRPRSELG